MTQGSGWHQQATAVVLALPELAAFTAPWRSTSYAPDEPCPSVERRLPPHVTVLAPFADPGDAPAIERLRAVAARHRPMDLWFRTVSQFGPGGAVWLVPEPEEQVMALVADVVAAFPDHPPYGGLHGEPIPHLTVTVDGADATVAEVRAALAEQGPLEVVVGELGLWQRDDDEAWRLVVAVPLGG